MKLTSKELEVMITLWGCETPLTTAEIIESTPDRTWQKDSVFAIVNTLIKKGAVFFETYKPTEGKHARVYKPLITIEDYAMEAIQNLRDSGMKIDISTLADRLKKAGKR